MSTPGPSPGASRSNNSPRAKPSVARTWFARLDLVRLARTLSIGGIGGALGGDDRRIAMAQAARVLMVVLSIPFGFRYVEGDAAITTGTGVPMAQLHLSEMWVLLACAVVGPFLGRVLRLPAYRMVGPLLARAPLLFRLFKRWRARATRA